MLETLCVLPSVAAAMEGSNADDEAVWYDSMEMRESVGVGPCTPVARGRVVKSSEPFGLSPGRIVRMEDVLSIADCGRERITVVLYSE